MGGIQNPLNNYQPGEQLIGTWIDGSSIYRYVIQSTVSAVNKEYKTIYTLPRSGGTLINLYGWVTLSNNYRVPCGNVFSLGDVTSYPVLVVSGANNVIVYYDQGSLCLGRPLLAICEYSWPN